MRIRLLATAAVAACAATTTAPAAGDSSVLVVRGDGSGYVDVDVRTRTSVDPLSAWFSGGGRWAALHVQPLEAAPPAGFLSVFRLPLTGRQPSWSGRTELWPGRYRLTLVAERPVEVRLGTSTAGWRPLAAAGHASGRLVSGSTALAAGRSDSSVRLQVGRASGAVMAMLATGQRLEDTFACATRGRECDRTIVTLPGGVPVDGGTGVPSASGEPHVASVHGRIDGHQLLFGVRGLRTTSGRLTAQAVVIS